MMKGFSVLFLMMFFVVSAAFPGQDSAGVQIEINAPKLSVFDAASQVITQQGFAILATNERIGLITTDYKKAEEAFGNSLLLSLFGRKGTEVMLSTNIVESNNKSILSIFPKARIKKVSRLKTEYEELSLSKKLIESFRSIGEKIKALAEQSGVAEAPAAPPSKKNEKALAPIPPASQRETAKSKEAVVDTPFIRVKVNSSNIRNAPSLQGKIVKTAPVNSEYKILGIDGDWFEILLDDSTTGYINKLVCEQFNKSMKLEVSPEAAAKTPAPSAKAVSVVSEEKDTENKTRPGKSVEIQERGSSQQAGSEKDFLFCLGGGLALTMGDPSKSWNFYYSIGFGIDLHALMRVVDRLYIGGYFGGYFFPGKYNYNLLRIQPMLEIQYRYPLSEKIWIFGGLGIGIAVDTESYHGYYNYSDTKVAFATDLLFGLRYGAFYFNPRFRFISHDGASYGSFDLPFGFIF